ncbi:MAG: molecular chaperone DnaJ [Thermoleophilia bacterium]|nr:molecular chaperone DnaJ [Thermoleophilia bacterium]
MATTKRDYYEILGVPRDADERAIKKAFRTLARELHPDVSEASDAEERFRELAEAYEVLSKPEARELYDRYGHEGLQTGGFRPGSFDFANLSDLFSAFFGDELFGGGQARRRGRQRGGDVAVEVEVDLVDVARGVAREVPLTVAVACAACGGSGAAAGSAPETCPGCAGAGRVQQVASTVFGQIVRAQACPRCRGAGTIIAEPCPACDGDGRVPEQRTLEVRIPAGIHDGQRIRLSGEGHAGDRGSRPGDAYVVVRVRPDERLARDGDDIVSAVQLTITQAALGCRVTVPTIDGELELEFKPGTQPGEVRVLRGKGLPALQGFGRGNHRLLVGVVVPHRLTDEQRRLLEEFERLSGERTYAPDEGFFERVRAAFH